MIENKLFFQNEIHQDEINNLHALMLEEVATGSVGYYDLPDGNSVQDIKTFSQSYGFDKRGIKNVAVLGIGGSSLGTKAIDALLSHVSNKNDKKLLFFENVDPNEITLTLKGIKLEETFFIVISKSGSTIETTSHLKYLLHYFDISLESAEFKEHFCFITDQGSPLDRLGEDLNLQRFYIQRNVGGRFSVLGPVGLLPLHILGYDIEKLLYGAKEMKELVFAQEESGLLQKALYYARNKEQMPITVLFAYSSQFKYFNDWFVQLWAESLGKINRDGTRVGFTPVGLIGSVDQHSFLQLIIEGARDKTVTMIKVKNFEQNLTIPDISLPHLEKTDFINSNSFNTLINAQCDATMQSIIDQGVPVDVMEIERLNEQSVGGLIFYHELLTSLTGILLNINSYDQPGVELAKVILKKKFDN